MRVTVTGGSGFIGARLVDRLIQDGEEVQVFDKRGSERFPELVKLGDVRDLKALSAACEGSDVIFHLAAEHADDVRPVSLYYDVNVGGAENVIAAAEKNGVKKIVFTSSVAVYALNAGNPDESAPVAPFNDYGKSKLDSEKVFEKWISKGQGRTLITVRPVVVFGEGNRGNVYNLMKSIAEGRFQMVGDGGNRKSMAYVGNVADFLVYILSLPPGSHLFNYADKPDLSTKELVSVIGEALGQSSLTGRGLPYWLGLSAGYGFDLVAKLTGRKFPISSIRIKKFCADTTVAAELVHQVGFLPKYSLADGVRRMLSSEFGVTSAPVPLSRQRGRGHG